MYTALKADIQGVLRADMYAFRQSKQASQSELEKQVNQQFTQIKGEMCHTIQRMHDDMVKEMQARFTQWKSLLDSSIQGRDNFIDVLKTETSTLKADLLTYKRDFRHALWRKVSLLHLKYTNSFNLLVFTAEMRHMDACTVQIATMQQHNITARTSAHELYLAHAKHVLNLSQ